MILPLTILSCNKEYLKVPQSLNLQLCFMSDNSSSIAAKIRLLKGSKQSSSIILTDAKLLVKFHKLFRMRENLDFINYRDYRLPLPRY